MSQFVETIKIENGRVKHIEYHNDRCYRTRKQFFGSVKRINLRPFITDIPPFPLIKCRILYNYEIKSVEYLSYRTPKIRSLQIVKSDSIDYQFKYTDRTSLDNLFKLRQKCDDILIIKNGVITDTYYANIALSKNGKWYTPENPLLKGTMREYLLKKGKLITRNILLKEVNTYEKISLFNSMITFEEIIMPIDNIKYE